MYAKKFLTEKEETALQMRLKELRLSKRFTQQQIADELYVSRECWSNYEAGHRIPSIEFIKQVADYFEVDVNYVMGLENTNREISEYLHRKMKASKNITPEGHLDISDLPTIEKMEIIDFCDYLKARCKAKEKYRQMKY